MEIGANRDEIETYRWWMYGNKGKCGWNRDGKGLGHELSLAQDYAICWYVIALSYSTKVGTKLNGKWHGYANFTI